MITQTNECEPNYQWRPAIKGDIGSIARFSNNDSGPFAYGILRTIDEPCGTTLRQYLCGDTERVIAYSQCHIQYDANEEP